MLPRAKNKPIKKIFPDIKKLKTKPKWFNFPKIIKIIPNKKIGAQKLSIAPKKCDFVYKFFILNEFNEKKTLKISENKIKK